jgi:hypothetical protein
VILLTSEGRKVRCKSGRFGPGGIGVLKTRQFLLFGHNIFASETLLPTGRAGRDYTLSNQKKGRIMAKLKGNAAVIAKSSKRAEAANAKALALWGACWMIGLAAPAPCGGR